MKVALLLPGYLDSPDYLHMLTFEKRLKKLNYKVERLDPCDLWKTNNTNNYSVTNYLKQIKEYVNKYKEKDVKEIILIGHSLGGMVAIIAGSQISEISKIISLCPPKDIKKSIQKFNNSIRISKRDLPNNPQEFREFTIPQLCFKDALQYSAVDSVKKLHKPLMIMIALDDTVVPPEDTEEIIKNANNVHYVKLKNIEHSFRHSQKECNLVMTEIEKFLMKSNNQSVKIKHK